MGVEHGEEGVERPSAVANGKDGDRVVPGEWSMSRSCFLLRASVEGRQLILSLQRKDANSVKQGIPEEGSGGRHLIPTQAEWG